MTIEAQIAPFSARHPAVLAVSMMKHTEQWRKRPNGHCSCGKGHMTTAVR
jgi:hypothetical protein